MAWNRIQLQKGRGLTQFTDGHGSEEKCPRRCFVDVGPSDSSTPDASIPGTGAIKAGRCIGVADAGTGSC